MSIAKFFVMWSVLLLGGCTTVQQLQELQVSLIKIEPTQSSTGLSPRFNVQLLVTNPNDQDLEIQGMTLQLDIANQKILTGVSNQIPQLSAYSETLVDIQTTVNLIDLFKLLTHLSQHSGDDIKYRLNARIDPKYFIPFNLSKEGVLNEYMQQGLKLNK
ncbi:MAG: LEA type 2 family protein [Psychromonas sp.]